MENYSERDFNLDQANVIYNRQNKIIIYQTQLSNGKKIVVKKQMISNLDEGNNLLREGYAMALLHHDSIIKIHSTLLGASAQGTFDYILLIMDYYPEGDLENEIKRRINQKEKWSNNELNSIFFNLIEGFAYMQERDIAHRDIKPQNILKNGNFYVISDLGNAFKTEKNISDIAGTPAYLSPKLRQAYQNYQKGFSIEEFDHNAFKSDVFSLGLVFLYMASLESIMDLATTNEAIYFERLSEKINRLTCSEEIIKLINWMLVFHEDERPDFLSIAENFNLNTDTCLIEIKDQKSQNDLPKSGVNINYPANIVGGYQNNLASYNENISPYYYGHAYENPNPNYMSRIENQQSYLSSGIQGYETNPINSYYPNYQQGLINDFGFHQYNQAEIQYNNYNPAINRNNFLVYPYQYSGIDEKDFNSQEIIARNNLNQAMCQFQNCDIFKEFRFIMGNQLRIHFKWKVWVSSESLKSKIADNMKKWMIEPDESYIPKIMSQSVIKFRVVIWKLYYKCKICNSAITDVQKAKKSSCSGYLHVDCIKLHAKYFRKDPYITIDFDCIACRKNHYFEFKHFIICQSCHMNCTYFKDFINNYICMDCLKRSSEVLDFYKNLSTFFIEQDGNQFDLCFYCNSFAELFYNNSYQVCYNCAIKLLDNLIIKNTEINTVKAITEESDYLRDYDITNKINNLKINSDETEKKSMSFNESNNSKNEIELINEYISNPLPANRDTSTDLSMNNISYKKNCDIIPQVGNISKNLKESQTIDKKSKKIENFNLKESFKKNQKSIIIKGLIENDQKRKGEKEEKVKEVKEEKEKKEEEHKEKEEKVKKEKVYQITANTINLKEKVSNKEVNKLSSLKISKKLQKKNNSNGSLGTMNYNTKIKINQKQAKK